jgi:hypothetical protein
MNVTLCMKSTSTVAVSVSMAGVTLILQAAAVTWLALGIMMAMFLIPVSLLRLLLL